METGGGGGGGLEELDNLLEMLSTTQKKQTTGKDIYLFYSVYYLVEMFLNWKLYMLLSPFLFSLIESSLFICTCNMFKL